MFRWVVAAIGVAVVALIGLGLLVWLPGLGSHGVLPPHPHRLVIKEYSALHRASVTVRSVSGREQSVGRIVTAINRMHRVRGTVLIAATPRGAIYDTLFFHYQDRPRVRVRVVTYVDYVAIGSTVYTGEAPWSWVVRELRVLGVA